MNNYKVYVHTNKINGKKYVGLTKQDCQERWRNGGKGYKQQAKFYRAIQKYGWDNFEHTILFTSLTAEQAGAIEKQLIQQYDSYHNGYNADLGGSVTNHSPETLEKMRQSMLGKKHTQETKDKISLAKQSEWISVICLETKIVYPSINSAGAHTNTDPSSITKCCRGQVLSAGGYTWRYADPQIANKYKQQIDNKINKAKKPVYCISTNTYYETVRKGAKATNSDESNIIKVCKGKYKSTNGLKWRYAEWEELKNEEN